MPVLMKSAKSWRNMIGQKRYKLKEVNWGKLSKACLFKFFSISSLEIRLFLAQGIGRAHLT